MGSDRAMAVPHEREGMQILDQLLAGHPGNIVITKRYLRFCYEWITFRLSTVVAAGRQGV